VVHDSHIERIVISLEVIGYLFLVSGSYYSDAVTLLPGILELQGLGMQIERLGSFYLDQYVGASLSLSVCRS
jgi:hypothetical protein